MSAYQVIGVLWSRILTPDSLLESFQKIQSSTAFFEEMIRASAQDNDYNFILPIPHVNRTGSVPIVKINEATGFYIDSAKSKVGGADLYGVTTQKFSNYDSFRKKDATSVYSHDLGHSEDQGRKASFFNITDTVNPKVAADLREKSAKYFLNNKDNNDQQKLFELAFFMSFHENASRVRQDATKEFRNLKTITKQVQDRIKQSKDVIDNTFVKVLFGDDKKVYKATKKELISLVTKAAEEKPDSIAALKEKLSSKALMNQETYATFLKEMIELYSTENNTDFINIFEKLNNLFKNQGVGTVVLHNLINNPASSFNSVKDQVEKELTDKLIENDKDNTVTIYNKFTNDNKFHITNGQPMKQFITSIIGAKHLGLEVKGETFSAQVDNFLDLMTQGFDIIKQVHSVELTGSDQT